MVRRPIRMCAVAAAMIAAGLVAGCASPQAEQAHPIWPEPPAPARVMHLMDVRRSADLVTPGLWGKFVELITGRASDVSLIRPNCIAVADGRWLYVTDQERQGVVVFSLTSSKADLIAGTGDTFFVSPVGVAACGDVLAVADSALDQVYVMTPNGDLVRTLAKPGGFQRPTGLAWDSAEGVLYVVDTLANEICVFDLESGEMVRRFGSHGSGPGQFNYPTHIFVDADQTIYITDSLNFRIQMFDARGTFIGYIGKLGDASGHLAVPKGVAADRRGFIYIIDSYLSTVQVFDRDGRFLLGIGRPGDLAGEFQVPTGLTIGSDDRIYVCDSYNRRVQVFQYIGGHSDDHGDTTP